MEEKPQLRWMKAVMTKNLGDIPKGAKVYVAKNKTIASWFYADNYVIIEPRKGLVMFLLPEPARLHMKVVEVIPSDTAEKLTERWRAKARELVKYWKARNHRRYR